MTPIKVSIGVVTLVVVFVLLLLESKEVPPQKHAMEVAERSAQEATHRSARERSTRVERVPQAPPPETERAANHLLNLRGRILVEGDQTGTFFPSKVRVSLTSESNRLHMSDVSQATREYEFRELVPGVYRAKVYAHGWTPTETRLDLTKDHGDTRRDLHLKGIRLVGVRFVTEQGHRLLDVLPDSVFHFWNKPGMGLNALGLQVRVSAVDPKSRDAGSSSDKNGVRAPEFVFVRQFPRQRAFDGFLKRAHSDPANLQVRWGNEVVATRDTTGTESTIDVVVPVAVFKEARGASLRFACVDAETGGFVPMVFVRIQHQYNPSGNGSQPVNGHAFFENLPPGKARIMLSPPGYQSRAIDCELVAGNELDLGSIELRRGLVVSALVVDADGKPLQSSCSWKEESADMDWVAMSSKASVTKSDGRLFVGGLKPAKYLFWIQATKHGPQTFLVDLTREGASGKLRFVMRRQHPVRIEASVPGTCKADVLDANGYPVLPLWFANECASTVKLPVGSYVVSGVLDGTRVRIQKSFDVKSGMDNLVQIRRGATEK